jgi:hypothetical protein
MMRFRALFLVLFVSALGIGTYGVSLMVGERYARIVELREQIVADQAAIRVLRTELAYLSRPEQVQQMSDRLLGLAAPEPNQILASFDALKPDLLPKVEPAEAVETAPVAAPLPRILTISAPQSQPKPPSKAEPQPAPSTRIAGGLSAQTIANIHLAAAAEEARP